MTLKKLSSAIITLIATQAFANTDEIIVTGTYSPVSTQQIASSVTVINQEELLALSSHSLVSALRQVPSIWVEEQGGPGGITAIALRGAESNHTLVLVDGVQVNDPTNTRGGAFDVNNINIDTIKRIEIIRGAQSAVYGSDALAGVINIITLEPSATAQTHLSLSVGDDGYKTGSLSTTGTANNLGYAVKLQSKEAGQPIEGSTAQNKEAVAKLFWKQDAQALNFSLRYFDGEKTNFPEESGGSLFAKNRNFDHSKFTDQDASLEWLWQVNDNWKSKASASWFNRHEDLTSPGIVPYFAIPPNGAITDFTRKDISWVNTIGNEKHIWSNIGVELKNETGESIGYLMFGPQKMPTDFSLERKTKSAFVNFNAYATDNLLFQGSVRRDMAEGVTSKNSTQIGARYQINDNTHWFINHGEGFKLPSFAALGHPLVGNADLKPETDMTSDTGIEWAANNTSASLSLFNNHYVDLIDFDNQLFKNVNRSKVDTTGAETEIRWHSMDNNWQLGAHASYADINAENPLMGRPQVKAGTNLGYAINEAWQLHVNYLWVDDRYSTSRYTGKAITETLNNYQRIDASVKWKPTQNIRVNFSIDNLTDEKYFNDVGFPAVGRTGYVNTNISF